MKKVNSSKFVILTIALIILASPLLIYLLCLLIKVTGIYTIVPNIGSVDTWISFAGSIIGGSITMLALYFTIQYQNKIQKHNEAIQIRPILVGELIFESKTEKVVMLSAWAKDIKRIFYIRWKLINLTNYSANNVRLISCDTIYKDDSTDTIDNSNYLYMETTINGNSELIKSNEEKLYNTQFKINYNENDEVDIHENLFGLRVTHTVVFEYTDLLNLQTYRNEFSFTLKMYLHQDKTLTILLDDLSNVQIFPERGTTNN